MMSVCKCVMTWSTGHGQVYGMCSSTTACLCRPSLKEITADEKCAEHMSSKPYTNSLESTHFILLLTAAISNQQLV
jgi:hypothetical protein